MRVVRFGASVVFVVVATGIAGCGGPGPDLSASPPAASPSSILQYSGTTEEQLVSAVRAGDLDGTKHLLDAGQNPNYWLGDATPLGLAIVGGDLDLVAALLDAGATVDTDEWTHSVVAAQYGDAEMVKLILNNGGTATGPIDQPGSVLAVAAYAGNVDAIQVLISAGADPNALVADEHGEFPILVFAVNGGSLDAVRTLAESGADPYLPGSDGKSAIDAAEAPGRVAIADYLGTVVPPD